MLLRFTLLFIDFSECDGDTTDYRNSNQLGVFRGERFLSFHEKLAYEVHAYISGDAITSY